MKIKFREKDKIVCWIIVGFFAIMTVLRLLKPLWANAEASETTPATALLETEPQETEGATMIIVEFIEPTRPTHPVIVETNKVESPSNKVLKVPKEIEDSKVEENEKTERDEEEKPVITEPEPEPEIEIEVETNTEIETNSNSENSNLKSLGTFKLTAYCACSKCCGKFDGITASGTKAKQGRTIAVDPRQIPYGTKVVINGHTYTAEDCGGGIGKNRIDVFFDSHKEALKFGVQRAEVFVYVD